MLRAQARASFRVRLSDKRGSGFLTPRVQTASISSSRSQKIIIASPRSSTITPLTTTTARSMSTTHFGESTVRPEPDKVVQDIADYVHDYKIDSDLAWETARLCLIDTIGCGLEGLRFPECRNLLGPVVEGTIVPNGESVLTFTELAPLILRIQEPRFPGLTTSSTRFEGRSTSGPSSVGSTSTIASLLQNVRVLPSASFAPTPTEMTTIPLLKGATRLTTSVPSSPSRTTWHARASASPSRMSSNA
jgi:MmgE/PrpD N-terminal domain